MEIKSEINQRLKTVRNTLNINQKKMAESLGVKPSYYSDVENSKRNVTGRIIETLQAKFGVSTDWMYSGKGELKFTLSDALSTLSNVPSMSLFWKTKEVTESNGTQKQEIIPSKDSQILDFKSEELKQYLDEREKNNERRWKYQNLIISHLKENEPEKATLLNSIRSIFDAKEVIESLEDSEVKKVMDVFYNFTSTKYSNFENVEIKNYSDYKEKCIEAIGRIQPFALIFNDFGKAVEDFTSKIRSIAKEINYEDDYMDLDDLETDEPKTTAE